MEKNKAILDIIRDVNSFSLPLILNNFFNVLISVIMASIVGRISVGAIISTEIVDTLNYAILGIAGVGTLVFNIESSKVRDNNKMQFFDWFKSCMLVNTSIGLIIVIMVFLFSRIIFLKVYGIKGSNLEIICNYSYLTSFSILANMVIFSFTNLLKVNKKTKHILVAGFIGAILQITLSYIFANYILNGNQKVLGVGIGSTISIYFQLFVYFVVLRKEIMTAAKIKSSKKMKMLIKSIPLVVQEVLEGSVFSVLVITLIARLGDSELSAYSVSVKIVGICLIPMYMYCNSLTVLVGEYTSKNKAMEARLLPIITTSLTFAFYFVLSIILIINKEFSITALTNIEDVQKNSISILALVIIFSSFQILFENSKYSLQSLGKSTFVLRTTIIANSCTLFIMLAITYAKSLSLVLILMLLAFNYSAISVVFFRRYFGIIKEPVK